MHNFTKYFSSASVYEIVNNFLFLQFVIKDRVMQIERALINDRFCVSKVYVKFRIPTIYNFAAIYQWNLLFSLKETYFLTAYLIINKTFRLNNVRTRTAMNAKISVFVISVEAIIYLLLYDLHDCSFKGP